MKLTGAQKDDRKVMKGLLKADGGKIFHFPDQACTVLVVPAVKGKARFFHYTTSYCAETETRYRRKTGEYFTLMRWYEGTTVSAPCNFQMDEFAEIVAYCFS